MVIWDPPILLTLCISVWTQLPFSGLCTHYFSTSSDIHTHTTKASFSWSHRRLLHAPIPGEFEKGRLFDQFIINFRHEHYTVQSTPWPSFVAKMIDTLIYIKSLYSKDRIYIMFAKKSRYTVFNIRYVSSQHFNESFMTTQKSIVYLPCLFLPLSLLCVLVFLQRPLSIHRDSWRASWCWTRSLARFWFVLRLR